MIQKAADYVRKPAGKPHRIGIEYAFLPADSAAALRKALPDAELKDALFVLERLRAKKSPEELDKLGSRPNSSSTRCLRSSAATAPAPPRLELAEALRREETSRGLVFDYCLIADRLKPQPRAVRPALGKGQPLSVDSGGNYHGYIGDLARMGIVGEPDSELVDLLAEIEATQQAAFKPIRRRRQRHRDLCRRPSRCCK